MNRSKPVLPFDGLQNTDNDDLVFLQLLRIRELSKYEAPKAMRMGFFFCFIGSYYAGHGR